MENNKLSSLLAKLNASENNSQEDVIIDISEALSHNLQAMYDSGSSNTGCSGNSRCTNNNQCKNNSGCSGNTSCIIK